MDCTPHSDHARYRDVSVGFRAKPASMSRFLVLMIALLASPAGAQTPPQSDEIVVQGTRESAMKALNAVRAITRGEDGSVPRFEQPVCPGVAGLSNRLAVGVVSQMRDTIAAAGIDLADQDCKANLTLIVSADGKRLIRGLIAKSPPMFGTMSAHDLAVLQSAAGPSWAWRVTDPKRADGAPVEAIVSIDFGPGEPPRPVAHGAYMARNVSLGRLSAPLRRDAVLAFVVIDGAAIDGLTVQQIGDYAVLRGLAPVRAEAPPYDSILAMFDSSGKPTGLTDFDRAYLAGLYAGGNEFMMAQKTRQIAAKVSRSGP